MSWTVCLVVFLSIKSGENSFDPTIHIYVQSNIREQDTHKRKKRLAVRFIAINKSLSVERDWNGNEEKKWKKWKLKIENQMRKIAAAAEKQVKKKMEMVHFLWKWILCVRRVGE